MYTFISKDDFSPTELISEKRHWKQRANGPPGVTERPDTKEPSWLCIVNRHKNGSAVTFFFKHSLSVVPDNVDFLAISRLLIREWYDIGK